MRYQQQSKTSLFLIELIITVFFFSLAAIVCLRLFVYAGKTSRDARDTTKAVELSRNAAEGFLSAEGDPEGFLELMEQIFPGSLQENAGQGIAAGSRLEDAGKDVPAGSRQGMTPAGAEGTILLPFSCSLRFSKDWEALPAGSPADAAFEAEFTMTEESRDLRKLTVRVLDAGREELYSLEVLHFLP